MKEHDETIGSGKQETVDSHDDQFLKAAVNHGLVSQAKANTAREHAKEKGMSVLDAVLSLSIMSANQIEAAQTLSRPKEFVPGYEINGLIGSGASGNIFRAKQTAMQRDVAIKTIKQQVPTTFESRMQREAEAIARLHHPNIVVAYESGFAQGRFYIAMELVEGGTLLDLIARKAPVDDLTTWQIIRQAAAGLMHANESGLIHRDIKPSNLLLATAPAGSNLPKAVPFVKVADFGLARDFRGEQDARITKTGVALGTPAYVAPEQLDDTAVDCRADIFALGATAFHLLSGQMPYADHSPMKAMVQKSIGNDDWRNELPDFVSDFSRRLFRDMTSPDPDDRIANYEELILRIDRLRSGDSMDETLEATGLLDMSESTESKLGGRNGWPRKLLAAIGLLAAIPLIFAIYTIATGRLPRGTAPKPSPALTAGPTNWQPATQSVPLFNGQSVPLPYVVGFWSPTSTDDGSRVLRGEEHSTFRIPLRYPSANTNNMRLRLRGRGTSEPSVLEFNFVMSTENEGPETLVGKLVVDEKQCKAFDPAEDATEMVPANSQLFSAAEDAEAEFRRFQVERVEDQVTVHVNGAPLAGWKVPASSDAQLVIRCAKGRGYLADIDIVELLPPDLLPADDAEQ